MIDKAALKKSGIIGGVLGIIAFICILLLNGRVHCDYPYYFSLEDLVHSSNKVVTAKMVGKPKGSLLDVGDGLTRYIVYKFEVIEAFTENAKPGEEVLVRIFKQNDKDDYPFSEGNEYILFLWDTDDYPAVLLNRDQSAIKYVGEDIFITKGMRNAIIDNLELLGVNDTEGDLGSKGYGEVYEDYGYYGIKEKIINDINCILDKRKGTH